MLNGPALSMHLVQETPDTVTLEQWFDVFNRYLAGEETDPRRGNGRDGDGMETNTIWLASKFNLFSEAQQRPMVERVIDKLQTSSDVQLLVRLLRVARGMGASGLRGAVQAHFESSEDPSVQISALSALLNIERAATSRGETRTPDVYQFWDKIMGNPDPEWAIMGFEGLRNLDLTRAALSLDALFKTGATPDRIKVTLRGMQRDAKKQDIDIGPALRDFLKEHPELDEGQVDMLREAFGEALIAIL